MKTIRSEYAGRRILKKVDKVIFSFVLTLILVLIIPGRYHEVYAAPLEDCDLDGFDDATGVPVPWPGYDETKGDTPDGPAGSKTTTTAPNSTASTTVDSSNSETTGNTSGDASDKTSSEKLENADNANSDITNSGVKDKTDKTSNTTSSNSNNTVKDNTNNTDSDKTSSEAVINSDGVAQDNTSKTEADNTNSIVQDKSSNEGSEITDTAISSNTNGETADSESSSVSGVENNQDDTSQSAGEHVENNSDNGETVNAFTSSDELKTVINKKGTLKITDATGGIIHAGSSVIISGSGFAGSIQNLELQIQSEPIQLGSVESSANGSFEVQLTIPNDLEAGVHHIVVLYQGKEITHQQVEVGPRAADSFLQALTVGFTKDNNGLLPGLMILIGLFLSAIGVLGVNLITRSSKAISKV